MACLLDFLTYPFRTACPVTLLEIQERLIQNCGERFSVSVLWRFFDRHGVTFKKRPRTPRSSGARPAAGDYKLLIFAFGLAERWVLANFFGRVGVRVSLA